MGKTVYLIRHGITEGLEKNLFYGWIDYPITENGFKELEQFKDEKIYPAVDFSCCRVYTSGMTRTNQTLNTIYGDVPFTEVRDLMEINFGDWEGKDYMDLSNHKEWDMWMNDTTGDFRFPNGETTNEFNTRITRGMDMIISELVESDNPCAVVVFHGGVTATLMQMWFPEEGKYFNQWTPKPGRGYTIRLDDCGKPESYGAI